MDDVFIVEMFWQRDENAINETEKKYSRYLYKIAYNILADPEDCEESVNDTYLFKNLELYATSKTVDIICGCLLKL